MEASRVKSRAFFFKDYDPQGQDGAIMGVAFYILINREKSLKIFSINKKLNLERKKVSGYVDASLF